MRIVRLESHTRSGSAGVNTDWCRRGRDDDTIPGTRELKYMENLCIAMVW